MSVNVFKDVVLEDISFIKPDERITSSQIENQLKPLYDRLNLPEGRLEHMTGIVERHFWRTPVRPSLVASWAAKKLQIGGMPDLLIHASVCRDALEPATAAHVHRLLEFPASTSFFDLSSACLGVLKAMYIAACMIEAKQIKRAIIVAAEDGKALLEKTISTLLLPHQTRISIKPYFANLTIGAGACAVSLCHSKVAKEEGVAMLKTVIAKSDTKSATLCEGGCRDNGDYWMQTDAEALLEAGILLAKETWNIFKKNINVSNVERIMTHQVGKAHTRKLYEALQLPQILDFPIYSSWGNIGAASLPVALAIYKEQMKKIKKPIALLGIGSGLASMMMELQPLN